jgi:hypothetical protein
MRLSLKELYEHQIIILKYLQKNQIIDHFFKNYNIY